MPEIMKVYREHQPALRFIGKRYTGADGAAGGFTALWDQWFENGWFDPLEMTDGAGVIENGYIGLMRCKPEFEYWIGAFLPPDFAVPDGYGFVDLAAADVGICWIKAPQGDTGIFEMDEQCAKTVQQSGVGTIRGRDSEDAFVFERYNCPHFTTPDADGNIVLDYGFYLDDAPVGCCQSCGMPFDDGHEDLRSPEDARYCVHCFADDKFTMPEATVADMVEIGVPHAAAKVGEEAARKYLEDFIPTLNRWR